MLGVFTHLENLVYIFRGIIVSIFRLNVANKSRSDRNDWPHERKISRGGNKTSKLGQTKCLKREETRVTMLQLVLTLNLTGCQCWHGYFWANHDAEERKMESPGGGGWGLTLSNRKVGKVIKLPLVLFFRGVLSISLFFFYLFQCLFVGHNFRSVLSYKLWREKFGICDIYLR